MATPPRQGDHSQVDDTLGVAAVQTLRRGQDAEHRKAIFKASQISFARGRIKAIMAGIERESRRCYDPERGKAILAVMLPYIVEA